jgi:UDP-glucose 4-epimerase
MQKKSILIGSNGYLGRHLAFYLKEEGIDNRNFDLQPQAVEGVENYCQLDITQPETFDQLNPSSDLIFLFSGITGTANGFEDYRRFIEVNETGLLNLLTWMRQSKCKARVVFPSTRLVYRGVKNKALREDDLKEALTLYAANKLSAEHYLRMYNNAFGIDFTVFRICVPYGNIFDQSFSYGTIGFFLQKALKNENIKLFGDGTIRRTFSHVEDICTLIVKSIEKEATKNEIFNIGGENLSLLDAAGLIAKKYGISIDFSPWPDMALKLESGDTVFDDAKMQAILNYSYRNTLEGWLNNF